MTKQSTIISAILMAASLYANAEIRLPSVIGDNMVLQQNSQARIWGYATPGKSIYVCPSWSSVKYLADAGNDGKWELFVTTPEASSTPYSITVKDNDSRITLQNVLVGEVWYCSGQSNMEIPMRGYKHQPIDGALDIIISAQEDRPIRMFTVDKNVSSTPLDNCGGHWGLHNPQEVAECSATAYYFADAINRTLGNIPVGIIISAWGGTNVQPWMSPEAAAEAGLEVLSAEVPVDRSTPDVLLMPGTLYNAMVAPVLPFTIKGMLWYQGENNCYDPVEYERLMPYFVSCMRKGFNLGDIPFYYVQVAPFGGYGNVEHNVGKLRIAQSHLMKQVENCGMAVTLDIGDRDCIHPSNKKDVGKRLAYWALAKNYGKNDFAWSGPVFNHMEVDRHRALLYFDNTGGGVSPLEVELDGFEAAGEDGVYHPARAIVECSTGTLGVYCPEISEIKKVRYGNAPYFKATLFDNFGLPASPFVTSGELE